MKKCLECSNLYIATDENCPKCQYKPSKKNDILTYDLESVEEGVGFESKFYADLAKCENGNFWFKSRNDLILWTLGKYMPNCRNFLEVGCGTGYVLSGIADKFPYISLYGSELFIDGLSFAKERLPEVGLMQMNALRIPFFEEFDAIGAFDVLEHIKEDEKVLKEIYTALNQGGFLFVTVPQHRWLWSNTDVQACHVRRYSLCEIEEKIKNAGFKIEFSTSFVAILLPFMLASRLWQDIVTKEKNLMGLALPDVINKIFYLVLKCEVHFIKHTGFTLPFGGSRFVVARKQ